ncbi:MAG: hypothetical protein JWP89_4894 [Schlesneria sp.]|nr:hypothetical protein [Schlesneria sp.]
MNDEQLPVERLVLRVVEAADDQRGAEISARLRDSLSAMAPHSDSSEARQMLASKLVGVRTPIGAGIMAMWLGAVAENGRDPTPVIPSMMEALLKWSRTIRAEDGESCPETIDDNLQTGMQWLGQGLVANLGRCAAQREVYMAREDVLAELERTEHVAVGCMWVAELLRKQSGTLLVVHVAGRKGCFVSYENISNCFHLFTLLQASLAGLVPGTKTTPRNVVAVARGESTHAVTDVAWWHYGRGDVPEANFAASVWGEGSPDQIPVVNGVQVLLLWPPIMGGRSWDGGFLMPLLAATPPSVTVLNHLTSEQLDEWWATLGLPQPPAKPRWKFW